MTKPYNWSVRQGNRLLDCGTARADSERAIIQRILRRELGTWPAHFAGPYTIAAGGSLVTAHADEFWQVGNAMQDHYMDYTRGRDYLVGPSKKTLQELFDEANRKVMEEEAERFKQLAVGAPWPVDEEHSRQFVSIDGQLRGVGLPCTPPKTFRPAGTPVFSDGDGGLLFIDEVDGLTDEEIRQYIDVLNRTNT